MNPTGTGKSCSGMPSDPRESSTPPAFASSSPPPSSPKYKGVRKRKWGRWVSEIRLPNSRERIWLGSYDSAEKAARAFDAALFCLRGRDAKFNLPSSPPDIVGAHNLNHQEIQAVAARCANESECPGTEAGAGSEPPSSTDHAASQGGGEHSIDWSFLGALDESEGRVSDFGLVYSEYEYLTGKYHLHYPPPAVHSEVGDGADNDDDHEDDNDGGSGGAGGSFTYHSSFLWNF